MRAVALLLAVIALPPTMARAYEDVLTLGVEAGTGIVVVPESTLPCCGPLLGGEASIGLGDAFTLRAHLAYAWHPSAAEADLHAGIVGLELFYLLDVVQIVPFFGVGADLIGTVVGGAFGMELGFHAIAGVDFIVTPELAIGIDLRPHFLVLTLLETGVLEPAYIAMNARLSYRFEL